jgi:hypothetical protein
MAKDKNDIIERKKLELEEELDQIQHELDDSIQKVRTDVSTKLDPIQFVKRHPWPVFGVSAALGFLLANLIGGGGSDKKKRSSNYEPQERENRVQTKSAESNKVFRPLLFNELKKLAARRAVSMASEYLDEILRSRRYERTTSQRNGRKREKVK